MTEADGKDYDAAETGTQRKYKKKEKKNTRSLRR